MVETGHPHFIQCRRHDSMVGNGFLPLI